MEKKGNVYFLGLLDWVLFINKMHHLDISCWDGSMLELNDSLNKKSQTYS